MASSKSWRRRNAGPGDVEAGRPRRREAPHEDRRTSGTTESTVEEPVTGTIGPKEDESNYQAETMQTKTGQ